MDLFAIHKSFSVKSPFKSFACFLIELFGFLFFAFCINSRVAFIIEGYCHWTEFRINRFFSQHVTMMFYSFLASIVSVDKSLVI